VKAVVELAGERSTLPAGAWPAGLTDREVEVLRLLARGHSNKAIARTLGISPKTVQHHVLHFYEKSGLSSRAAGALFAVEHGLLT
jgi:DNA-binding NarL/FixJ family response regulator